MSAFFSSRFSYRARARSAKKASKARGWIAVTLLVVSAFSLYAVLFPGASGMWGRKLNQFLIWLVGQGRFVAPVVVFYISLLSILKREKTPALSKILILSGLFGLVLVFLSLLGEAVWHENYGGTLGLVGMSLFVKLFGHAGSWIFVLGLFLIGTTLFVGLAPAEALRRAVELLANDWKEWQKARRAAQPKEKRPPVVPVQAGLTPPAAAQNKPLRIMGLEAEAAASSLKKSEKATLPQPSPKAGEPIEKEANPSPKAVPVVKEPYKPPSLDIFDTIPKNSPVGKEELTSRARLLEQTLANFNIAASVVEVHPGPVITRYDLEPAPGVKVSSIASRADDLALALKSTGIRVLAPIPGKGAVGVEIPNLKPENVGLRELLGRPEFANHESPLAFVLGKTVSGEPYIIDLAAMPHMLIAGATGSGKSVCVHALICSILYRMSSDLVKFVLIDPKRLELPSYSMIPHIYDPRCAPAQAAVITNSKQAAKALARLVKVMEYRYELFAKANVRNIDSYNKKRKAAGEPPEYYIVVVIDELADLMITAPKEVEDAIQRLAQMARAVGIHLVLATQRPSVDVITGVIKANLPARIALRVASAMDSRVIIDSVGAETLLGKGDMLFLPPASPEPIRVQGAYVSEKEVENLVNHVKQFGQPAYDDLFGSGSALEFAVEDKKEMKDLVEALKLVMERRRVSQDLLKAHFGSSARATNILSLMEVKEFIHKPEGSNRWEINFDQIEGFLSSVERMPEQEMAS